MSISNRNHKYISRKWQNGRWVYEYDYNRNRKRNGISNNSLPKTNNTVSNKKSSVPDAYNPNLKPDTLYGKNDKGYTNNKKVVKCAQPVGDTMGRFHPHG